MHLIEIYGCCRMATPHPGQHSARFVPTSKFHENGEQPKCKELGFLWATASNSFIDVHTGMEQLLCAWANKQKSMPHR